MIASEPTWLTRVAAVFGVPLGESRSEHIRALTTARIGEAADLEFKGSLYGASDRDKQELCKDVAGMRNAVGGVIVLGVSEEDGVAVDCPGVPLSDTEQRRMRQIVAAGTAPYAEFDITPFFDTDPGHGFYLLLAPPSARRPHAVVKKETLGYPRRDGTLTRWLTEVEVADLYRDRFRGQADQLDRLARIGAEASDQIEADAPWLIVSAVPNSAGSVTISFEGPRRVEQWMRTQHSAIDFIEGFIVPPAAAIAGVGVARYTLTTHFDVGRLARSFYAECHVDGSAAAARRLNSAQGDGTVLADALVITPRSACVSSAITPCAPGRTRTRPSISSYSAPRCASATCGTVWWTITTQVERSRRFTRVTRSRSAR